MGPANWDAVWVFVKFQPFGQNYKHATLSTNPTHHKINNTNGVGYVITPSADGKGVFMYRSNNSAPGPINWQNVELRWNYPLDGVLDTTSVTIQVFAIEMVYIPEGSFYIGDGNIGGYGSDYSYRVNNQENVTPEGREAYLVTSENAIDFITSSSTATNSVYDPTSGDYNYTLPADFPKGYAAFYCMKYELSQKQYVDFFNTLPTSPVADPKKGKRNLGSNTSYRNYFTWSGNNLDNATTGSSSGDLPQNCLGWADACAWADWAALRPMSELEYEKICRGHDVTYGPIYPVKYEYPWGNTNITNVSGSLTNALTTSEGLPNPTTNNANAQYSGSSVTGPLRCGIFAAKNQTTNQRQQSGASFYGVMELGGNLAEMVVSTFIPYSSYGSYCTASQPLFSRNIHGDGALNSNGNCNIPTWTNNPYYLSEVVSSPLYDRYCYTGSSKSGNTPANIAKIRGGSFGTSSSYLRTSDRNILPYVGYTSYGNYSTSSSTSSATNANVYQRNYYQGFRAVRTAP